MESTKRRFPNLNPLRGRSKACKFITGAIGAVLVLTVALLAWGIPWSMRSKPKLSVILPLYIYPSVGAWDNLYTAMGNYPYLQFLVIINPNSGPGNNTLLDENYQREIPKVNQIANALTVGYVRTNYTNRSIHDVLDDVNTYASWADADGNFTLHGIFFDETPNNYTAEIGQYMSQIDEFVKHSPGFRNVSFIVHNPGTLPDDRLLAGADVIVVYEGDFNEFQSQSEHNFRTKLLDLPSHNVNDYKRQNFSYIFSGVPSGWTVGSLQTFVQDIQDGAQWMYVTSLELAVNGSGIYEDWGTLWPKFTQVMSDNDV